MIEGKIKNNSGQSMLFMVMSLSSIIVMVASLSSLIMVFELRQATDSRATGEAIMAADTGVECAIYDEFYGNPPEVCGTTACEILTCPECKRCYGEIANDVSPDEPFRFVYERRETSEGEPTIITWTSAGEDAKGRAVRALEIKFIEQR
jgi:hypothetical protein